MAISQTSRLLWIIGAAFVILPHFNVGLLSDYKICGDSECESLLSRVQAIRDHHGKDCRFLSFRQGDTIFIYHKLTGKRDDLWAGSIDKQFGYFPKDAVREEQVYSTVEKVVETQESDFFCMDEFGYPIDSAHLDNDDDESDQKVQIQESETTQNTPNTDDTNVESPLTSADPSTESPVSPQETEEDTNNNFGDAAHGPHEEAQETPATLNEQGGSPSSSWLGSSVTGWLGLAKEEQPGNLAEGEEEDDMKEIQADDSLASSVTGWLGFGDKGKPEKAKESVKTSEETARSFTSTMTGWLGFGDEKKTEQDEHKEMDEEKEEPLEKFRSRRMSLDLEGSQLHVEENEETGTLGWLGNGLSNTLGFGQTNQDSGNEAASGGESEEEKEQLASSSWLDVGIGGILGFQKDNDVSDDSTVRDFKETEEDAISQQPAGSQSEDTHQSQSALTDEGKTETSNESEMEEPPKDLNAPSTEAVTAGSNDNDLDIPDSSKSSVLQRESESIDDHRDLSSHTKSEEKSQAGDGMSSMFNSIFQSSDKEDKQDSLEDDSKEKNKTDEEIFVEVEAEHHEMPKSAGNERTDITREPGEEEFKTQSDSNLGPNHSFVDLKSNSIEQSVDNFGDSKKDQLQSKKTESAQEEGAEITHQAEESTDVSGNIDMSGENHEGESSNEETELPHRETFISQTEESAEESQVSGDVEDNSTQSQLFLSSADERNEPISAEDESFTPQRAETNDNSDALAGTDNNVETHTHYSELGHEEETQPVNSSSEEFKSSHFDRTSTESLDENASEEDRGTISSSESTAHTDQASVSPQMDPRVTQRDGDTDELNETVEETVNDNANNLQQTQTEKETSGAEEEDLNEGDLKSTMDSETQAGEVEESESGCEQETIEGGENEKIEHLKEVEEVKEEEKQEEKQDELEELKEDKNQEEIEMKENEKLEEHEELKGEIEEKKVEGSKEEDEELQQTEELKEERVQEDEEEVRLEEQQQQVRDFKEEKKPETLKEVEEINEEEKQEEVKEEQQEMKEKEQHKDKEINDDEKEKKEENSEEDEKQEDVAEVHGEEKGDETQVGKEEQKLGEVEEQEEDEQQKIEGLLEKENQASEEELKKEEKQGEMQEFEEVKEKETKESEGQQVQSSHLEEHEELKEEIEEKKLEDSKEEEEHQQTEELKEERLQEDEEEVRIEEQQRQVRDFKEEKKPETLKEVEEINEEKQEEVKEEQQEIKEQETKESEGQQVQSSHLEEQEENIQNNISKSEPGGDNKETEDGKDLAFLFTETAAKTENPQGEVKDEKTEGKEEEEKHQERDMEEDDLKGSSELCSQPSEEESVAETDGGSSEEGTSSQNGDSEIQIRKNHGNTIGTESWSTGGLELSAPNTNPAQSQAVSPEQTASPVSEDPPGSAFPPDDLSRGTADSNTGGALGLFKNTFGFFSQTPTTETKGSTESAQSFNANPGETSQTEASLTPEQEPDSTSDLRGNQDAHIDSSITTSTELPLPYPSSSEIHLHTAAPNTEVTLQTKTISKVYKNLLEDMSVDETAVLVELFGQYKLQFLDYILVSSEVVTEDLDHDESILSDIERLLHHHRETLVAPRMGLTDAPQEDKEKTRTLIALQKLEMLLARVRKTFDTGQSDHQAEASCVGASCSTHNKDKEVNTGKESRKIEDSLVSQDNYIHRDGWMELEKDSSQVGGGTGQEMETVDEKRGDKGNKEETVSSPYIQPGSPQPLEGMDDPSTR